MLIQSLLNQRVAITTEADERLVQFIGFIRIECELCLCQLHLGIIIRRAPGPCWLAVTLACSAWILVVQCV